MKLIVETHPTPAELSVTGLEVAALLVTSGGSAVDIRDAAHSALPIFYQAQLKPDGGLTFPDGARRLAIDTREGQADLDRISAELRIIEARNGRADRSTALMIYPYPDAASLADRRHDLVGSERLFALALDEPMLLKSLTAESAQHGEPLPAPLVYARARLVAASRILGVPSYLKPLWRDDAVENMALLRGAKRDGFDGVIVSSTLLADLKNA